MTGTLSWTDTEMACEPSVIVVGQYSTGKTSLINYLTDPKYPESKTGDEPTTDKFVILQHGSEDVVNDGKNACSNSAFQFKQIDALNQRCAQPTFSSTDNKGYVINMSFIHIWRSLTML
uniref:Dynamin_N domain-containing protein n=1 Tax=Rhabditophanes sp. KR3021 TaxID=114890 RepID=A0AC35U315_9BILA